MPSHDASRLRIVRTSGCVSPRAKYRTSAVTTLKTLLARQGEDHPHHTTALYSLAQEHRRRGNSIGFGDTLCQLITLRKHQHLPQDSLKLKAHLQLVTWRARHGETTTVVSDLRQIVKACEDRLGRQHADTLAAEFHLAHWLWETGHPKEARNRLVDLQPRQRKILGREAPRSPRPPEAWSVGGPLSHHRVRHHWNHRPSTRSTIQWARQRRDDSA